MEDFSKWALFMGAVFNHVLRWIVMKRDCELPWVVRLARWLALGWAASRGVLDVFEKAQEVGLW